MVLRAYALFDQLFADGPSAQRLIVFDFDLTIMREHLTGVHKYAPVNSIPITDERFADLAAFRAFVRAAVAFGHAVAIATFGRLEVVEKAMLHALGNAHGVTILTPGHFGVKDGTSGLGDKNTQLEHLARQHQLPRSQVILLDDDPQNIRQAHRAGFVAFEVPPGGVTRDMLGNVAATIGLSFQLEQSD